MPEVSNKTHTGVSIQVVNGTFQPWTSDNMVKVPVRCSFWQEQMSNDMSARAYMHAMHLLQEAVLELVGTATVQTDR